MPKDHQDLKNNILRDAEKTNSELNKLVYWAIKILKQQFEKDPYSLSSEELMAIKLYDTKFKEKSNK